MLSNLFQDPNTKAGVLSGLVCALVVSIVFFTPLFRVNHIEVNLNDFVTQDEIVKTAQIEIGKTAMVTVSEGLTSKRLKAHPYIKSVIVEKAFPDKIKIMATYREDFIAINDSGFFMILDDTLQVLRVDKMYYEAALVEGFTFQDFKIGEVIAVDDQKALVNTVRLLKLMKQSHVGFLNKVTYDGLKIQVYTKQGLVARFSRNADLETSFNHFADIYDHLASKGIKRGLIDVSNDGLATFKPFE